MMKKVRKIAVCVTDFIYITHNTHPVPLTSGFRGSPGPPPLGNACGIVPVHHYSHLISQQVWRFFCLFLHMTLLFTGAILSEYLPNGYIQ
jgi:hypothetical protein